MENEKLKNTTTKRYFSLPNSSKTRKDRFAQNVLYHSVFTAFVLETDLSGEVKMDVFISSFVTNLPQSLWWLVFKSSCPERKLMINAAVILTA